MICYAPFVITISDTIQKQCASQNICNTVTNAVKELMMIGVVMMNKQEIIERLSADEDKLIKTEFYRKKKGVFYDVSSKL